MKYLILESRAAYCVALGEDGRCVKCANMHYQPGDRVDNVIELKMPARERSPRRAARIISLCAAMAACLCLAFFGWYQPNYAAYGTMRLSINPDVELTLSRTERVLEANALNADGEALLEGFDYSGMYAAEAADALVARSIEDGWLAEGGTVTVSVDGGSGEWRDETQSGTAAGLEEHYGTFAVIRTGDEPVVTIPVPAATPTPTPAPSPTAASTPAPTQNIADTDDDDDGPDDDGVWDDDGNDDDWDDTDDDDNGVWDDDDDDSDDGWDD